MSDADALAAQLWRTCQADGQAVRRVDPADQEAVRAAIRVTAREHDVHVRTAVLDDDVVVVARTDAAIWDDDTATMRRKLTPPA